MTKLTKLSMNKLTKEEMKECPVCHKVGFHKLSCGNNAARVAIPMTMHTAFIPTLEGDEAEEFIRKAKETPTRNKDVEE